jgi:hypothetical protein
MKIASLFAVLLFAAPAFAAGRGRAIRARASRLSLSSPTFGRTTYAFGSFARTRFATRSSFAGAGLRGASFSGGSRSGALGARTAPVSGNVPSNGGSAATRGTYGAPYVGTMTNSTTIGGPNGAGTQTVAAGAIVQNPGTAVDSNRSPGVTWGPPDARPSGGGAGGNGAAPNSVPNSGF